jgi:hypothetical protein
MLVTLKELPLSRTARTDLYNLVQKESGDGARASMQFQARVVFLSVKFVGLKIIQNSQAS